jgi:hypothetical protein
MIRQLSICGGDDVGGECSGRSHQTETANKLTLNADKTSYLVFGALNKKLPGMPPFFYETSPIKRVNEVKYLGLNMDEQLNFKRHIEKLRGKISPTVGMLHKLKFYLPSRILKSIYHAFIHSNYHAFIHIC